MGGDRLCPVTPDGRHKRKPWAGDGRSGFACAACHKTWTYRESVAYPTYADLTTPEGIFDAFSEAMSDGA
ncbi:hypothetical protein [Phenylobacterium sp.]|uniref:hypothetical protein n=1 Tax=Phenylobacterium sp. TaxID=1871053 RepID=UPI0027309D4F|nr:hypothetical protein [Phenylobacterium sp.]MDP1873702.1 hypothetical protein [Phenylobacterium sp.]